MSSTTDTRAAAAAVFYIWLRKSSTAAVASLFDSTLLVPAPATGRLVAAHPSEG
jgi:hypothetical protein